MLVLLPGTVIPFSTPSLPFFLARKKKPKAKKYHWLLKYQQNARIDPLFLYILLKSWKESMYEMDE
jgi:hypothetical protein